MALSAMAEANTLSMVLRQVFAGEHRFPVKPEEIALDLCRQRVPNEPITAIKDLKIEGFEGTLVRHPKGHCWKIGYSSIGRSPERIRFTIAHELGHYLLHRQIKAKFECSELDMHDWDSVAHAMESEADVFASYLLMPLDDFRTQVQSNPVSIDLLKHCADRYGVSLMAAALKWIEIAPRRAVVVAARDGFLLWARSNKAALESGALLKTRVSPPREVPAGSLLASGCVPGIQDPRCTSARTWFPKEPESMQLTEHAFVASGRYDYTLGVLVMPEADPRWEQADDAGLDELDGNMRFHK